MFIVLTYDVNKKRTGKVMKICRKYLLHVQKSVFEGVITEAQLSDLKRCLGGVVIPAEDAVCIYELDSFKYMRKERIGMIEDLGNVI